MTEKRLPEKVEEALDEFDRAAFRDGQEDALPSQPGSMEMAAIDRHDTRARLVEAIASEIEERTRWYLTLVDVVCRSSTGLEDACRQARETRDRASAAEAEAARLRERLADLWGAISGIVFHRSNDGTVTVLAGLDAGQAAMDRARSALSPSADKEP